MICSRCQSSSSALIPAEVRLYRNVPRTLSLPPMTPSPDIRVCLDCGLAEFSIPQSWLSEDWLRFLRSPTAPSRPTFENANLIPAAQ
jgi:hypothetical protein